jgi:peroxiredoxin Q/BCP
MKRSLFLLASLCLGMSLATAADDDAPELKVGDMAPAFELPGSDGKTYKSADYKDKKAMVIAWFPKAKTGG